MQTTKAKTKKRSKKSAKPDSVVVSYHRKPTDLTVEKWQRALRRQFAEIKPFGIEKLTNPRSPFGDYTVHNPETGNSYKVAFRGVGSPMNFCSCMDFKTNNLGTCKHLEALILRLQKENLRIASREYSPDYTSVYLSYRKGREVKIRIGNSLSAELALLIKKFFDSNDALRPTMEDEFVDFLAQARRLDEDFRCYDDALDYVIEMREHKTRLHIASEYGDEDFADLLKTQLFPYQKEGIRFAFGAGRSLNADEMGLGKTIQAIGFCEMLRKERGTEKALIICPTSLKYQWQSEIQKFTDEKAFVIEGAPHIRREQYARDEFYKIVSYNTVVNDIAAILEQEFDVIILDEAQRIKNWKTKIAQSVKKLQTPYCMVLTGTPLENKIEELYSIVQYVNPYILGPYWRFMDYYQVKDDVGKVIGYRNLDEIGTLLAGIVKRRRKSDVLLQLPDRMDKNLFVPMTLEQSRIHCENSDLVARLVAKWRRIGFLTEQDRQRLLCCLNMMRMSCDSTFIIDQKTRHDTKIDELMNILQEYFDGNNYKAVIFSQWERMTRLIAQELDTAGIEYQYLHGGVPSKERKALFDTFNSSATCRVFLSTDAGSTGLNLQAASLIINMDVPWNPAVLEQRIARIHRMGQKSAVSVINFVSLNTIEHRMLNVLKFKSSLAEGILDHGESAIFLSDSKFNAFMQEVEQMTESDAAAEPPVAVSDEEENAELRALAHTEEPPSETAAETPSVQKELLLFGDDDFEAIDADVADKAAAAAKDVQQTAQSAEPSQTTLQKQPEQQEQQEKQEQQKQPEAAALISQGFSFLSGLAQTLSTPEGAKTLARTLTERDPHTGRTSLKIPVESEETVANVLTLLGNLFKGVAAN